MFLSSKRHPFVSPNQDRLPITLGINGIGRIGKLNLWHHVTRGSFDRLTVNVGRESGKSLEDLADYIVKDSTYGPLDRFIHGFRGGRVLEELDEQNATMRINGTPVTILREHRNPKDIEWRRNGVKLVVDCTGVFTDPSSPWDAPKGSLRGHIEAGAEKAILSAPFKPGASTSIPDDAVTIVRGINEDDLIDDTHTLISSASCTTTCLSFMVKPLLDFFGPEPILTASMVTVHAATGSQAVLDRLPAAGDKDLRKTRSTFNNVILTTTGAADTLKLVLPEMRKIGFMAESVRIPTCTGSLVILTLTMQDDDPREAESEET